MDSRDVKAVKAFLNDSWKVTEVPPEVDSAMVKDIQAGRSAFMPPADFKTIIVEEGRGTVCPSNFHDIDDVQLVKFFCGKFGKKLKGFSIFHSPNGIVLKAHIKLIKK